MRIAHVYRDYLGSGGIPRETVLLARAMVQRAEFIAVYTYTSSRSQACTCVRDGVTVRSFYMPPILWARNPLYVPPALRSLLAQNQDRLDAAIVTSSFIPENYSLSRLLMRGAIPYALSVGAGFNPFTFRGKKRYTKTVYQRLFEHRVVADAVALRLYSDVQRQHLAAWGHHDRGRCFVVKEGIDWDLLRIDGIDAPEAMPTAERGAEPIFGFLGRLDVYTKGLDLLMVAWAQYKQTGGRGRLLLVGPGSDEDVSYLRSLRGQPSDDVVFLGPRSGAAKYRALREMDVLVHPARHEGIPRSIREAFAVGRPAIVTDNTNVHDLIEQHGAGYWCRANSEALAARLAAFDRAWPSCADAMSANAAAIARELDWTRIASAYVDEIAVRIRPRQTEPGN